MSKSFFTTDKNDSSQEISFSADYHSIPLTCVKKSSYITSSVVCQIVIIFIFCHSLEVVKISISTSESYIYEMNIIFCDNGIVLL